MTAVCHIIIHPRNFNLSQHLYETHDVNIFGQNILVQCGRLKVGNHLHRNKTSVLGC